MSKPRKLSVYDKAFLLSETPAAPMHVGSLSIFSLPKRVNRKHFHDEVYNTLTNVEHFVPPFGQKLASGPLGLLGPVYWEDDPDIDINYHIKRMRLATPGSDDELYSLVSTIHASALDQSRPLWEIYLLEGFKKRRFAVYTKVHHAAVDGSRGVNIAKSIYTSSTNSRRTISPLDNRATFKGANDLNGTKVRVEQGTLRRLEKRMQSSLQSHLNIRRGMSAMSRSVVNRKSELSPPFLRVPSTAFNSPVKPGRNYLASSLPYKRVNAVAKVLGGSFNDTVLAICAGALKRYLQEHAALPCESLKANVPVSLREKGDSQPTNLVASFSADLATHIEDPVERFRAIKRSTRAGKKLLRDMPAADAQLFSTLIYLPGIAMMPPGLKSHFPPVNIVISNLPPIARKRYWNGAELLGMYPVSLLTEGMGLNITFIHYGENVNFGLTACNYSLPDLGPLARYLESALRELEANI